MLTKDGLMVIGQGINTVITTLQRNTWIET